MNLEQFREKPELVDYARKLLNNAKFQMLLEALREAHPKNFRHNIKALPVSDKAEELGRIYGYDEYENNLRSAAEPNVPRGTMPEATFGVQLNNEE